MWQYSFCFQGAVLANRLSENENFNVLLLNAGGDENLFTEVPLFTYSVVADDNYVWKYNIERQTNAFRGTWYFYMNVIYK